MFEEWKRSRAAQKEDKQLQTSAREEKGEEEAPPREKKSVATIAPAPAPAPAPSPTTRPDSSFLDFGWDGSTLPSMRHKDAVLRKLTLFDPSTRELRDSYTAATANFDVFLPLTVHHFSQLDGRTASGLFRVGQHSYQLVVGKRQESESVELTLKLAAGPLPHTVRAFLLAKAAKEERVGLYRAIHTTFTDYTGFGFPRFASLSELRQARCYRGRKDRITFGLVIPEEQKRPSTQMTRPSSAMHSAQPQSGRNNTAFTFQPPPSSEASSGSYVDSSYPELLSRDHAFHASIGTDGELHYPPQARRLDLLSPSPEAEWELEAELEREVRAMREEKKRKAAAAAAAANYAPPLRPLPAASLPPLSKPPVLPPLSASMRLPPPPHSHGNGPLSSTLPAAYSEKDSRSDPFGRSSMQTRPPPSRQAPPPQQQQHFYASEDEPWRRMHMDPTFVPLTSPNRRGTFPPAPLSPPPRSFFAQPPSGYRPGAPLSPTSPLHANQHYQQQQRGGDPFHSGPLGRDGRWPPPSFPQTPGFDPSLTEIRPMPRQAAAHAQMSRQDMQEQLYDQPPYSQQQQRGFWR
jgi:hypothetical protein